MDMCVVTGTLYNADGNLVVGMRLYVRRVELAGSIITTDYQPSYTSDAFGVVTMSLPQGSQVTLYGLATGFDDHEGVTLSVPDAPTGTLEQMLDIAAYPAIGLVVKTNGAALAGHYGDLNFSTSFSLTAAPTGQANVFLAPATNTILGGVKAGTGVTILPDGTLNVPAVSQEIVQDYLATFFNATAPVVATYNDALDRVDLSLSFMPVNPNGVAGGQTINGGTGAGESLTLSSTAHATKGFINFGASSAYDGASLRLGLATSAPTHTLTLGSTGNGAVIYNTSDQTTNYERGFLRLASSVLTLGTEKGGTGTVRSLQIGPSGLGFPFLLIGSSSTYPFQFQLNGTDSAWINSTGLLVAASHILGFGTTSNPNTATIDAGIGRHAANALRITDGSTGAGSLLVGPSSTTIGAQLHVVAKDATTFGQIIQMAATPNAVTGIPFKIWDSTGATLSYFDTTGALFIGGGKIRDYGSGQLGIGGATATSLYAAAAAVQATGVNGFTLGSSLGTYDVSMNRGGAALLQIGDGAANANGTISAAVHLAGLGASGTPSFSFVGRTNSGMYSPAANQIGFNVQGADILAIRRDTTDRLVLSSTTALEFSSAGATGTTDLVLLRDAADTLALRRGGTSVAPVPQAFRVYNWWDGTNGSWLTLTAGTTTSTITLDSAGTGVKKDLVISSATVGEIIRFKATSNGVQVSQPLVGQTMAPMTDSFYNVGSSSFRYQDGFFSRTINLTQAAVNAAYVPLSLTNVETNSLPSTAINFSTGSITGSIVHNRVSSASGGNFTFSSGSFIFSGTVADQKTLIVKGASLQSGNLQEWQDSAATVKASVTAAGVIQSNTFGSASGSMTLSPFDGNIALGLAMGVKSSLTFALSQNNLVAWASTTNNMNGALDTSFSRQSPGVVQAGDGGTNANGSLLATNFTGSGNFRTTTFGTYFGVQSGARMIPTAAALQLFDAANTQVLNVASGAVSIGVATPNAKSILDLTSTTLGFLCPRMTTTQRDAITSPPEGLSIYNLSTHKLNVFTGSVWEQVTSA